MRRRGLVLGENTVIPSAVANTMQKISGTSSDKPVASTSSSSASSNPVASVLNDPKYSQFLPSERIALSETIADLKRKSDDELGSTAIEALTKSALSLWGAATR